MLPLIFPFTLQAAAPVVDLTAKSSTVPESPAYTVKPMSLEQRVQLLERRVANDALIEVFQRLDALQIEMQQLRGMVEEQGHSQEGVKQRQRDLYIDLDQRISDLQKSIKALTSSVPNSTITPSLPIVGGSVSPEATAVLGDTSSEAPLPASSDDLAAQAAVETPTTPDTLEGVAETSPATSSLQEQESYQLALDQLMAGSYEASIGAFTGFLATYPKGEYRANAQYWLGEAYYVSRQFDQAIESFNQVVADKTARKRPDAMLKSGFSFYELKRWAECREVLEKLKAEYPDNAVASLAEQRLQMLRAANLQ